MNVNILSRTTLLLFITFFFFSCNKEENSTPVLKNIEYEVTIEKSSSGAPFYVQGSYTNENGKLIKLDEETPWSISLKNVPMSVKSVFQGKLYCIDTKIIKGIISMKVTDSKNDKVLYKNKKELDLTKYVTGSLGFDIEEMNKETYFKFEY